MECIIPTMLLDGYLCAHLHRLYLELALTSFRLCVTVSKLMPSLIEFTTVLSNVPPV
jgi:hypothetical protein